MLRLLAFLALMIITLVLPPVYIIIVAVTMTLPVTLAVLAYLIAILRVDRGGVPQIVSELARCLLQGTKPIPDGTLASIPPRSG